MSASASFPAPPPVDEPADDLAEGCEPQDFQVTLCTEFDFSGDKHEVQGSTWVPAPADQSYDSCAQWAAGAKNSQEQFSTGLIDKQVGGKHVEMQIDLGEYTGPGTYPANGGGYGYLRIDGAAYQRHEDATGELTVNADGSGELAIDGLSDATGTSGSGNTIDGSITWTCMEPKPQ